MKDNLSTIPFIGKKYKVISGPFTGFVGECVSYDLESSLPVILQDSTWNSHAVKLEEIEVIGNFNNIDISRTQKN